MTDLRTAAQQALEALEAMNPYPASKEDQRASAIAALRAALAQQAEPMALDWLHKWANQDDGEPETQWHEGYEAARRVVQIHLTAPPQRKPLTQEDVDRICASLGFAAISPAEIVRAVERAHGIGERP